jgi:hypothetical protein
MNCLCSLASSSSANLEEGLFWDRKLTPAGPFAVKFQSHLNVGYHFDAFLDLQRLLQSHAPLYTRGWVVQELSISPRTIHFSQFPAFECRESYVCESYRMCDLRLDSSADCLSYSTKTGFNAKSFNYGGWSDIVLRYSRCRLIKPTDMFIAFRGLTKILSSKIPGPYYGGVWLNWWLHGILWRADRLVADRPVRSIRLGDGYVGTSSSASVSSHHTHQ